MTPRPAPARETDIEVDRVGLPIRPFLYTLDQIATVLGLKSEQSLHRWLHFDGRSPGARPPSSMLARNIAEPHEKPEWRVAEREFLRWCRNRGFKFYERGWVQR